ncbi:hypothetical protein HJG60_009167 [Phyllostomus discolor]|uniref:Uncharacterized protein n=1 Tax=Phyllostomus discolor TaxID=89673 RepID=A0A833YQ07_9CHIR|nr:hypothetical protein HJG60_009167 [Phyllostomus discolor]
MCFFQSFPEPPAPLIPSSCICKLELTVTCPLSQHQMQTLTCALTEPQKAGGKPGVTRAVGTGGAHGTGRGKEMKVTPELIVLGPNGAVAQSASCLRSGVGCCGRRETWASSPGSEGGTALVGAGQARRCPA